MFGQSYKGWKEKLLSYARKEILFIYANGNEYMVAKKQLLLYEKASGQKINLQKIVASFSLNISLNFEC